MFAIGDIVSIYAPVAGHDKYHLCINVGQGGAATKFLFLNSDPTYDGCHAINCTRIPCLPPSKTGVTVFSFTMVPRYSEAQLLLYKAKKLGVLSPDVAAELLPVAECARGLNRNERELVVAALKTICDTAGRE